MSSAGRGSSPEAPPRDRDRSLTRSPVQCAPKWCAGPYASGVLFGFGRGGGSEMIPFRINQRSIVA